MDQVLARFDRNRTKLEHDVSSRGLAMVSIAIRRATEEMTPVTPVDTGNLRASWFAVTDVSPVEDPLALSGKFTNHKFKKARWSVRHMRAVHQAVIAEASSRASAERRPNIYFGYSARYAIYVHEMLGANFKRKDEDGKQAGARWFSAAINRNMKAIIRILNDNIPKL